MTSLTRHTIRATALHHCSPAAVLQDLNRVLLTTAGDEACGWRPKEQGSGPSFCTVCLAAVTPSEGGTRVVVSAAGHPLPLVVRHDAHVAAVGRPGSLVGVLPELELSEATCVLGPGDALVLFTDGITERRRGGQLFEAQMPTTLQALAGGTAGDIAGSVQRAAVAFGPEPPEDDMAVLVISVPKQPRPGRADQEDPSLSSAGTVPP